MCTAEIIHYQVDQVIKKTCQGLKEQAHSVLHHDKTINHMLTRLEKLEGERSEIDQYQKLLEVVQAWDMRIDLVEHAQMCSHNEMNQVVVVHRMELSVLKACFNVGQAEN